jgi:DNA-binding response OmpR family regulator
MKHRILSLSANPELGKLRVMVLRQAGYDVVWPSDKEEAERSLRNESFDILLIGHTIPGDSARDFAQAFRARNPNGKIIAIMATTYLTVKTDNTVKAIDGPEALLEAIQEVLGSGRSAANS